MRYFIILLFLSLYHLAEAQAENSPNAPKRDSIEGKDLLEEKESLKNERYNDDYRGRNEQNEGVKKASTKSAVKSAES